MVDEGNGDTKETELSEVSGLNGQVGEGEANEPQTHPVPEEINRTLEPLLGIDGDKMVEKQRERFLIANLDSVHASESKDK